MGCKTDKMNNIKEKLINLHNAMTLIETKGDNTIIMADCLKLLRQYIMEIDKINDGIDENNSFISDSK